jgi:UDP-N-acetyl-D-mannosaminuronate dehydrogenase
VAKYYPFQIGDFVGITAAYIAQYQPALTIIHSTLAPGTTRQVWKRSRQPVAYSAVRGKHASMHQDILGFTKFVSGPTPEITSAAAAQLRTLDLHVEEFDTPEALEVAKLLETTYFGVLIGWAQEAQRFAASVGAEYDEVMRFTAEIDYLPSVVFQPGFIGGHCVMPNIDLLQEMRASPMLDAIEESNEAKAAEWLEQGKRLDERLKPIPTKP